ncbi:MAG: hypothetical protein HYR76_09850 [Ignavibacteria bacterium]|nr:hypothetical protein [Ignavibacteria bacterium]MBI3765347.1 hypothetical protein [Ignavibacteriales bacterium]
MKHFSQYSLLRGLCCGILLFVFYSVVLHAQPQLNYFMNINYFTSPSEMAPLTLKRGTFALGQFDLFATSNINDRIDVLSELVFEAGEGSSEIGVDLERIEIGYAFSDWLNIRMGRFHTPLGYYANAFHHGRIMESAIDRPMLLEFEDAGGLIPAHAVGIWGRGQVFPTFGVLKYNAGVVTGEKISVDEHSLAINLNTDDNTNKAIFASLAVEPTVLNNIGIGGSLYNSIVNGYNLSAPDTAIIEVNQTIIGGNLYYDELPLQLIAEYYAMLNKDHIVQPSKNYASSGYFVQCAYEFEKKYRPYFRLEHIMPEYGDPYTTALFGTNELTQWTVGFRYNLAAESAIKVEARSHSDGNTSFAIFGAQWSFLF